MYIVVFLGGSCNPTTWRDDLAIPFLKENSVTYYNPQVSNWRPELIEIEDQAKQVSKNKLAGHKNNFRCYIYVGVKNCYCYFKR